MSDHDAAPEWRELQIRVALRADARGRAADVEAGGHFAALRRKLLQAVELGRWLLQGAVIPEVWEQQVEWSYRRWMVDGEPLLAEA